MKTQYLELLINRSHHFTAAHCETLFTSRFFFLTAAVLQSSLSSLPLNHVLGLTAFGYVMTDILDKAAICLFLDMIDDGKETAVCFSV